MPIFFIAVLAILLPVLLGAILAFAVYRFDRVVDENQEVIEQSEKQYNPALTLGYKIKATADPQEQFVEARRLAAAKAAALPRGANMRIGRKGAENLLTAHDGVTQDPMTAVKIATFHGWDGARTGIPAGGVSQQPAAKPAAAGKPAVAVPKPQLIEITDAMSPEEVRKARIANAKAKSTYNKALKAAGADPAAAAAAPAAAPVTAPATAPTPAAAATGVPEPDYIDITDDMSPDEVRKARIANAKAKSAYNKALKAAGVDPAAAVQPQTAPAAAPTPDAPAPEASLASAAGVPEPDYIEITDDMSADEIRKARIANAKAKSAYNKALKAAGIDPAEVGKAQPAPAPAAQPEPATEAPAPAATEATAAAASAAAAGIPEPDYTEITDDMSPDEIRQARIGNAKAKAAYNKALKAAGIDPASVS